MSSTTTEPAPGTPIYVITMVPAAVPETKLTSKPSEAILMIRSALMSHGGAKSELPVLVGDATVLSSKSIQSTANGDKAQHPPYDAIVTKHASLEEYKKAIANNAYKAAIKNVESKVLTYGFEHDSLYLEWLYPVMQKLYSWMSWKVDCNTPVSPENILKATVEQYEMTQANGDSGLDNYKTRAQLKPHERVYVIEFITKNYVASSFGSINQAEFDYNKAWLQAAYSYQVKRSFGGTLISLDNGPKTFSQVDIMEFPSREVYIKWLESDYFEKLEGTRQAFTLDTQVQINLPFY